MGYCKNCGTQNEDNAKFCTSCGSLMNDESNDIQQEPQQTTNEPVYIVLSVLCLIWLIYVLMSGMEDNENDSSSTDTAITTTISATETEPAETEAETKVQTETYTESATTAATEAATEPATPEQQIQHAFESVINSNDVTDISVTSKGEEAYALMYKFVGTVWDETDLLETVISDIYDAFFI